MGWEVPPRVLFSSHPSSRRWGREAWRGRVQPYIPRQNQEDRFTPHTYTPVPAPILQSSLGPLGLQASPGLYLLRWGTRAFLSQESSPPSFRLSCQAPRPIPGITEASGPLWAPSPTPDSLCKQPSTWA